jgi:2-polyprenyl-3-methyl-5-hydroxy-6-metoxy-1,4-benzoquinol methylase
MNSENLRDSNTHFAFGKNWMDYAAKINDVRIKEAAIELRRLSGQQSLVGRRFLDVGCGSGLHALAALQLGVSELVGTDIDSDSILATKETLMRFAPRANYKLKSCSIFDMTPAEFGTFDVVYSWGVLHHTGDLHQAIKMATNLVSPEGKFLVALYRKTLFCGMWRTIKRWYSHTTEGNQTRARNFYILIRRIIARMSGRNFDIYVREYSKRRGMEFYIDVHDWLGGYPYESITPKECRALLASLGFKLEREYVGKQWRSVFGLFGSGCDEYAFRRNHPEDDPDLKA